MSGMVGLINQEGRPADREVLRRLTESLAFRGPDDHGVWIDGDVGLGHTLLRTTFESESERQPCSLDGQVWITADARIDGRADLIKQLAARGCAVPKNSPDVELILHAYQVWGEDCLSHLLGDFAFAIWDGPRRRLLCARDHLGVKPFYYADTGRTLVFSNTLNCVRQHPDVSDRLNDLAIADFLLFDFNQDPATTSFADIRRLPPAHYLTWEDDALRIRRYWTLPQDGPLRYPRPQEYVDHFKELLHQAVADRLRTRRVGVFMSGGLDSSTITATAKNILQAQLEPYDLRAYTDVYDRLIPDRERHYSGLVAGHLAIPIYYHVGDEYKLYERADQPEMHWPEPFHFPLVASWVDRISRVRGHSRVILTGQGGDPILYPSPSYFYKMLKNLRIGQLIREVGQCAVKFRCLPQVRLRSSLKRFLGLGGPLPSYPSWLNRAFAVRLDLPHRWQSLSQRAKAPHPVREEVCEIFLDPFWSDMFEKQFDAGSLGLPVEFRHPLLDVRMVNFALALPPIPWCVDKTLLREAAVGLLPEDVRGRPKAPLAGNLERELLRQPGARWLDRLEPISELADYVDSAAIPTVTGENDAFRQWINLRPRTLNYWLASWGGNKEDSKKII